MTESDNVKQRAFECLKDFRYNNLDGFTDEDPVIRLLELLPTTGDADTPIEGRLTEHKLLECPTYECLSYCWGATVEPRQIICNQSALSITTTLHTALEYLRFDDGQTTRMLWIDQISINQEDELEKSQQVAIMRHIFERGKRTVAWLGEASSCSDMAIDFLEYQHEYMLSHVDEDTAIPDATFADVYQDNVAGFTYYAVPTDEQAIAMLRLVKRPWFSRCWIIQEAAVSKEVLMKCGRKEIDFEKLAMHTATSLLVSPKIRVGAPTVLDSVTVLSSVRGWLDKDGKHPQNQLGLAKLLARTHPFGATDPRDKLFALLGVTTTDLTAMNLLPDYQSSVKDVYMRAAHALIVQSKTLEALEFPRGPENPEFQLPNWVPRWMYTSGEESHFMARWDDVATFGSTRLRWLVTQALKRMDIEMEDVEATPEVYKELLDGLDQAEASQRGNSGPQFCASKGSECSGNLLTADGKLHVSGHIVDKIKDVTDVLLAPQMDAETLAAMGSELSEMDVKDAMKETYNRWITDFSKYPKRLAAWEDFALKSQSTAYVTGEPRERAYWKTLCGGYVGKDEAESEKLYYHWKKSLRGAHLSKMVPWSTGGIGTMLGLAANSLRRKGEVKTFATMSGCTLYRRLAKTAKGYFALVPGEAQVGDVVSLLRGGRMPFVLRPGGGSWKFIGTSYVHGIMFGEAYDEDACAKVYLS